MVPFIFIEPSTRSVDQIFVACNVFNIHEIFHMTELNESYFQLKKASHNLSKEYM